MRSRPSWLGVNVRSGPYAVPFMVIEDVVFGDRYRMMRNDESRSVEIAADGSWES